MTSTENHTDRGTTHRHLKGFGTNGRDSLRTDAESGAHVVTRARLLEMLGGRRGIVDGGLPPLVFALVNAVAGANMTQVAVAALSCAGWCSPDAWGASPAKCREATKHLLRRRDSAREAGSRSR
jgi:hypothetical protein